MKERIKNWLQKHFLFVLYGFLLIAGAGLIFLNFIPANDTATRYAPMAEAFAAGMFTEAYHPMYGTLFQTVSGCLVFLFSLDGFRACQLTALFFWATALFPIYGSCRIVWDRQVALMSVVLYFSCSHLQRYVYDGLRDNGRTLGIALIAYGFIVLLNTKRFSAYLIIALGGWILAALRADGLLFALVALFVLWIVDLHYYKFRFYRSITAIVLFLLLIAPQCYMVWKWTGVPLPSYRHVIEFRKVFPLEAGK